MSAARQRLVLVGSADRTGGGGRLELLRVTIAADAAAASMTVTDAVATGSVAFAAVHPVLPLVYVASEDAGDGVVTAYAWSDAGLRPVGEARWGGRAAHLCVSDDGRHLVTADYGTSSVTLFGLDAEGVLAGPLDELHVAGSGPTSRQESPHPHQVLQVGDVFLVPDLGTDLVRRIAVSEDGALHELDRHAFPPGTGPRHAVVLDGVLYVACELSGEIRWDPVDRPAGFANVIPSSHTDAPEVAPSAIRVREGRILVANRGPGTVLEAVPTPDGLVGEREFATGGTWPRDVVVDDDVLVVADNRADAVHVLAADTGAVLATHAVSGPTCVLVLTAEA